MSKDETSPRYRRIALLIVGILGVPGLALAAPANDTCAGAIPLTLNRITKGTTVDANDDYHTAATPACYTGSGQTPTTAPGRDVVYKFTAPVTGLYSFRIVQNHPSDAIRNQNAVLYVADPDAVDGGCPAAPGTVNCLRGANRSQSPTLVSSTGLSNNQSEEIDCIPLDSLKTYYVYFDDGKAGNAGSPISLEPIACTSESEPNDTPATANPYVCGILGSSTTAPAAHCRLGTRDGAVCTRSTALDASFPDSNKRCSLLPGKTCTTDAAGGSDCGAGEGFCQQLTDLDCDPRCDVGPNAGKACATLAFCNPGGDQGAVCAGTCQIDSICVLGSNAGNPCTPICVGGLFPGRYCSTLSGCPGGGTCGTDAQCPGGTCSRQFNEGDEDFFSLGSPPAGSKVFAGVDAKSANDYDWRMRITTATSTLQFDDDDGTMRNGTNAPEIAGAVTDGTNTFIKVSRTSPRTSEPYELYSIVRPPLASAQLEDESGPLGNDITYGWPGDVVNANYATSGGYVRGTFDFARGEFVGLDSDCFKFLVNEGDLMDWFGDGNPGRIAGGTNIATLAHPIVYDAEPAGIVNFVFAANARKNTLANVASAGLSGLTPAVTSSYFQWRASYTGMLEVCFYDASVLLSLGNPAHPSAWAGSLSVNCGPLQPAGPGATTTDVSIVQTGPAGPVQTGRFAELTFTVTNNGAQIAQEVRLADTLPPQLAFVSLIADDGFGGNNTACVTLPSQGTGDAPIDCINTSMAPGAVTTYTLTVQVKNCIGAGQNVANTASITTVSTDPNASNDHQTASFTTSEDGSCVDLSCDGVTCVPDLCTNGDHCDAGVCVTAPADCDDNSVCTEDSCDPVVGCIYDPAMGGCYDDFNPCTANTCDPILGCVFPPMPAGTACDDGLSCTNSDACDGQGACVGFTACDDGDACTYNSCEDGVGCYFPPISCDDGNNCTTDSCDPVLGCRYVNNTNACNDGNACTTDDACEGGTCVGGPAPDCDDGSACTTDSCDVDLGCVSASVDCNDGNVCTTDTCNVVSGCQHANNTITCSDGNACTAGDTCGGGSCQPGTHALNCDDGNACTTDTCNTVSGCQHANNTIACNDGNACTTGDVCGGGSCHSGTALVCDDANVCTTDSCAPASGCVFTNNTAACDDGNVCTANDTCSGGTCSGTIDQSWTPTSVGANVPSEREFNSAVWTGTEMIVWGGRGATWLNTGGRYNPATNTWTPTSTGPNVPSPRSDHTAVWTGTEMIVWGGWSGNENEWLNTGGRYNPVTDTWAPISTGPNAPSGRVEHSAVWTGTEMIVWGGYPSLVDGARYNPSTDTWTPMSTGSNVPSGRSEHSAVWTGTEMIVWGGFHQNSVTNTGARYNPSTDTWTPVSIGAGAPTPRYVHHAVWTGSKMMVWGGRDMDSYLNSGGMYNPVTDAWTHTSTGPNVPTPRLRESMIWAGNDAIVWGGFGDEGYLNTGARYHPASDTWTPTPTGSYAPSARMRHFAVWTGTEMIIWGGDQGANTGARLRIGTDGNACDDGNACTTGDTCSGGTCGSGAPLVCNDANVCTDDSCNPASGCVHTNTVVCNDGNPCTNDSCNPASGCVFTLACDDGDACTTDACVLASGCHHAPINCFDDDSCTIDTCQPASGCQHAPVNCEENTSAGVGGGQTVTTDPEGDGATPGDPVESSVTTPNGGTVTIEESQATTTPPVGLSLLDLQIHVTAPPATAADPVRLVFRVDASVLPPGFDVGTLVVFKNGVAVAACTGAPGIASPDPCVASQLILSDGDLEVILLSSTLSTFNFGFPDCQAPSDVTGVRIGSNKDTVTWNSTGGAGTRYDVVRGLVNELPVGSGASEACVDIEVSGASVTDPMRPTAGTTFWYLVRARNACGLGGYGTRSNGAPRNATECP